MARSPVVLSLLGAALIATSPALAGDPVTRSDEPVTPAVGATGGEATPALRVLFGLTGDDDTDHWVAVPLFCHDGAAWLKRDACLAALGEPAALVTATGERLATHGRGGDEDRDNMGLLVDPPEAWSGVATLPGLEAVLAADQCRSIGDLEGAVPSPGGLEEGVGISRKAAKRVAFKDDDPLQKRVRKALRKGEWRIERALQGKLVSADEHGALVAAEFTDPELEMIHPLFYTVGGEWTLVEVASEEVELVDGGWDPYFLGECHDVDGDGRMELLLDFGYETMRSTAALHFDGARFERIGDGIYHGD